MSLLPRQTVPAAESPRELRAALPSSECYRWGMGRPKVHLEHPGFDADLHHWASWASCRGSPVCTCGRRRFVRCESTERATPRVQGHRDGGRQVGVSSDAARVGSGRGRPMRAARKGSAPRRRAPSMVTDRRGEPATRGGGPGLRASRRSWTWCCYSSGRFFDPRRARANRGATEIWAHLSRAGIQMARCTWNG